MTYRIVKLLADPATPEVLFHGQWQGRPSVLDEFKPYLDGRWNQGCTNAWKVWEEIVPLGYTGSYQRVRAYFRTKRRSADPLPASPPSPRTVAGWILRHPDSLTEVEQLRLKAVLAHCAELDALTDMSGPSPRFSSSVRVTGSLSGSTRSAETTCPASTPSPQASTETATPSSPASPCPGTPASSRDASTESRCSSARCSNAPASNSFGKEFSRCDW
ncbi:hypothetical protein ACFWIY_17350 [Streptomyces sioyaensis]|uniref:hypothetical protein n=1 Tax=Streptomyces sioyaensis TaxID=67364 RepID=UPI00365B3C59